MIKVFYTHLCDTLKIDVSLFSDYRKERLSKITNDKKYRQSITAEYLLCYGAKQSGFKIPADIYIASKGKPLCNEFHFNLSHSENIVTAAISDNNVGIDVQFKNPSLNMSVAKKIFTPEECENMNMDNFYKKFAMKESYFKMTGEGLPLSPVPFSKFKPCFFDTFEKDNYVFSVCTEKQTDVIYEYVDIKEFSERIYQEE